MTRIFLSTFLSLFALLAFLSCDREVYLEDPSAMVFFSQDTLRFDTVFTEVGSITRSIRIYNPYNKYLRLDRVYLKADKSNFFRLNVDGQATNDARNIEIPPKDSVYVFAEVTISPDMPVSISPFIVEDDIVVEQNGREQSVLLQAYGQNANYIPNRFFGGKQALLSCDFNTITWDDPKPYVIYGVLAIDSCELVIPEGTQVYVHGGIGYSSGRIPYNDGVLVVLKDGKLSVQGSVDQPVVFQGDRLESEYSDVPGQWGGIFIGTQATGSSIQHAIIKNSIVGVRVDSLGDVTVDKSQFYNQSAVGVYSFHAKSVNISNSLFYNPQSTAISLQYGGTHQIDYCTVVKNTSTKGSALAASNYRCLEPPACLTGFLHNDIELNVRNTVFQSNAEDALNFARRADAKFDYNMEHSAIKAKELFSDYFADFKDKCLNCVYIQPKDTLFLDAGNLDFRLDTSSILNARALPLIDIQTDLLEQSRDVTTPDIGCYELKL